MLLVFRTTYSLLLILFYQIAVHNTLTHNSLTKQITFMPFYMVINKTPFTIQIQETNRPGDPWTAIESEQCVPLWPKSDKKTLHVRAGDDDATVSRPFKLDEAQCTLLKMKNRVRMCRVDATLPTEILCSSFRMYCFYSRSCL